jgi:hypothetical protein
MNPVKWKYVTFPKWPRWKISDLSEKYLWLIIQSYEGSGNRSSDGQTYRYDGN